MSKAKSPLCSPAEKIKKAVAGANKYVGELAFLSKENSDLKDEVENLIKIIDDINVSLWDIWNNTKDLETARKIARDAMKKYGEL